MEWMDYIFKLKKLDFNVTSTNRGGNPVLGQQ